MSKPDWEVRVAVVSPPYEFDPPREKKRQRSFAYIVFALLRSEQSNIALGEAQLIGGEIKKGEKRKEAAQRNLAYEMGLDVSQRNIRFVGDFTNVEDEKTTLSHLYLVSLAKPPERISFPFGKNIGAIALGSYDGITISPNIYNRESTAVLKTTLAFDTRLMMNAALALNNKLRSGV